MLKYRDLYKKIGKIQNKHCDTCLALEAENLPYNCQTKPEYCNKTNEQESFIKFYDDLDKATQLHKLESKCLIAYSEYTLLNCSNGNLKNWVIEHYDIYKKVGISFFCYLEFNSKNYKSIYITEAPDKSFGVAVRGEDFESSIRFYEAYNDLYNNQKIYPEKIKEWNEIFAEIEYPKDEL